MQIHIRFIPGENIWAGLQNHVLRPGAFLLMSIFPIEIFQSLQVRAHTFQGTGQFLYSLLLP